MSKLEHQQFFLEHNFCYNMHLEYSSCYVYIFCIAYNSLRPSNSVLRGWYGESMI